jgi:hypothetical protein
MHRQSLWGLTLFTVVLTGVVLSKAGWFRAPVCRADLPRPSLALYSSADDAEDETAYRYRVGGAKHWRACLIQK